MNILLVEDNADHRELMSLALTGHDPAWQVEVVVSGEEALSRLAEGIAYDLVLLDYRLPKRDGLEVLEEIKQGVVPPPVVMITGEGDEEVAVEALKGGAYDYVVKTGEYLQRLPVVAHRAMEAHHLVVERRRAEQALRESEKKYSALVENSPDIIYVLNPEGNFSFVGGDVKSLLGFISTDLIGKHFTSIIWPEDVEKAQWHFNERRTGERGTKRLELRLATKQRNGKPFDIRYRAIEVNAFGMYDKSVSAKDKKFFGTYGVARDITDRKQAEEALRLSNEELLNEHNQRKLLSKRLIELLEKDRHEIAMELHDHIGQILTSLKMNLELLNDELKTTNPDLVYKTKPIEQRIVETLKEVKNVSHGLRPSILDALGLVPSLRELFNDIQRDTDIKIKFFSRNIPKKFAPEKALAIYRIAQEALTNVVKHALSKEVFVNLIKKDKKLSLSVEDDGVGFDQEKARKPSKRKGPFGLLIMRERAIQIDGEFSIESQIGKGTHLLVEIPL